MTIRLNGQIHGRHLELDRETGLPDGANVIVRIETEELPLAERRRRVRALSGAWLGDDSIEAVFNELSQERLSRVPREIDLNDPS